MPANARRVAVNVLQKVNNENAYSNIALNSVLNESALSSADKAFVTALFYGVLDRKITLDYVLDSLTKTPFKKVDSFTANVLRVGLYQIMYMDRVPNSAAVDEAVKIIKKSKVSRNAGFVNAVLRAAIRSDKLLPEGDGIDDISVRYSCPKWILEEFIRDYGIDASKQILAEFLKPSPIYINVNTTKITVDGLIERFSDEDIQCEKTDIDAALKISGNINIDGSKAYKQGLFYVQDISSQTAVNILNPKQNERLLDMCAAPGGKSFASAILMQNKGELISTDIYEKRVGLIKKGAEKLGLNIIKPIVANATEYDGTFGKFDAVLCDVPCSGLGIIMRKPDIKYKEVSSFVELEQIQLSILKNAVNYLKDGGRILYSTCTIRRAENEEIVNRFLKENSEYRVEYMHTFLPHIDSTDGFFVALIKKR